MLGGYGRFRSPRIGSDRIAAGHPNARFNHIDVTCNAWRPKPSIQFARKQQHIVEKGAGARDIYIISTKKIRIVLA